MNAQMPGTQIHRHCSDTAQWEMVRRPADPRLRRYAREYIGYDERSRHMLRRLEVAKSAAILILNLGPRLRLIGVGARPVVEDHGSFLAGMYDGPVITETQGSQRGVEIKLTPIGAYLLIGRPMSELTNRTVALDDLFGVEADELVGRLQEAEGWEERFLLLDAFLGRRIEAARPVSPEVAVAWRRLEASRGGAPIGALAKEAGWSRRRLIDRFRVTTGLAPKTAARLLRFAHATDLVDGDTPLGWAELALHSGYYDQAHLIRDFRQFAGLTPGAYRRRLLPDSGGISGA